jgi:hypothetical protein
VAAGDRQEMKFTVYGQLVSNMQSFILWDFFSLILDLYILQNNLGTTIKANETIACQVDNLSWIFKNKRGAVPASEIVNERSVDLHKRPLLRM